MSRYVTVKFTEAEAKAVRLKTIAGCDEAIINPTEDNNPLDNGAALRGASKIATALLGEKEDSRG